MFKTLVASADGQLVVAVVPVSGELSLKALAAAVGAKTAGMAEAAMAERATGYVVGGISPIGQKRRLPTLVDESGRMGHHLCQRGRRGLELEIAPSDLVRLTNGLGVDREAHLTDRGVLLTDREVLGLLVRRRSRWPER